MANTFNDWIFTDGHVEPDVMGDGSNYISSESIVVCAAPATADEDGGADLASNIYPIGVLESAAVIQNKQVQQLFEIGSRKPYFVPGRTRVQVGLSRVIFDGNSLMAKVYEGVDSELVIPEGLGVDDKPGYRGTADQSVFFFNLASSYFNKPFGLVLIMHDKSNDEAATLYLENCMLQSHQMNIGANQTIVMENVNILCDNVYPMEVLQN